MDDPAGKMLYPLERVPVSANDLVVGSFLQMWESLEAIIGFGLRLEELGFVCCGS